MIMNGPRYFAACPTHSRQSVCFIAVVGAGVVDEIRQAIREVSQGVIRSIKVLYNVLWVRGWARVTVICAVLIGFVTALLNTWLLGSVNTKLLPVITDELASVLEREVRI